MLFSVSIFGVGGDDFDEWVCSTCVRVFQDVVDGAKRVGAFSSFSLNFEFGGVPYELSTYFH